MHEIIRIDHAQKYRSGPKHQAICFSVACQTQHSRMCRLHCFTASLTRRAFAFATQCRRRRELEMEEQSAQLFRSDANAVEMEKAKHVKAQRTIWDNLLGMCVGGCF